MRSGDSWASLEGSYSTSVSNRKTENPCLNDPGVPLVETGKCRGLFVFIKLDDAESKERWLGFFSNVQINARHDHPIPIESKMDSMIKDDIKTFLTADPSITPSKISNGYGIGYSPITVSNAAGNNNTLNNFVYRSKAKDPESASNSRNLLSNFEKYVSNKVDNPDTEKSVDKERNEEVLKV